MTAVHTPIEKTRVYTPVWLAARLALPRGLSRHRLYRRAPIASLSPLWPESQLREYALKWAPRFIHDMALQGNQLLSAEANVVITGPLPHIDQSPARSGLQTAKRHVLTGPAHDRRPVEIKALQPLRIDAARRVEADQEDWIIEAQFLSTRMTRVEHTVRAEIA